MRQTILLLSTVLAAILTTVTPTAAAGHPPPVRGATYVALGDSFASGSGVPPMSELACARSAQNYPALLAERLHLVLVDRTCGGATIEFVTATPQPMTEQTTPQIDSVTPDTALVTITIGGNDANILLDAVRLSCAHDPGPVQNAPNLPPPLRDLLCGPVDRDADRALAEALEPRLVELIEAVQARAPHARIIITDYVELLPRNGAGCAVVPLTRDEAKFIIAQQLRTNLAIEHAAQRTGATLLDISRDSRGHDACSAQPWVNGYQFGDFTVVGLDVYHARLVAHEAIAARAGDLLANAADSDEAR